MFMSLRLRLAALIGGAALRRQAADLRHYRHRALRLRNGLVESIDRAEFSSTLRLILERLLRDDEDDRRRGLVPGYSPYGEADAWIPQPHSWQARREVATDLRRCAAEARPGEHYPIRRILNYLATHIDLGDKIHLRSVLDCIEDGRLRALVGE